jgi:uncharacterized membrane protein YfcA
MALNLLLVSGLAAFFVGLSKGGLPSVGMLAVPILSFCMPPMQAAALLLPVFVLSDVMGVWLYRKQFSARNLKILIPAGVGGVFIGWLTTAYVSDRVIACLIGLVGIGFCLNTWLRRPSPTPQPAHTLKGIFWGSLAGFTSFISHSGAPPFQVYVLPQRLPKLVFAGTSTLLFAVINAAKIIPYQNLQPYSSENLWQAAILLPFAWIGTFLGAFLTKRINEKLFFLCVQIGLFAVSLKLIWDALLI